MAFSLSLKEEKDLFPFFDVVFILFSSFLPFYLRDEWQSRKMRTGSGQMVVWLCEGLEPQTGNGAFSYYINTRREKQTIQPGKEEECLLLKFSFPFSFSIFFLLKNEGRSWRPPKSLAHDMEMKRYTNANLTSC